VDNDVKKKVIGRHMSVDITAPSRSDPDGFLLLDGGCKRVSVANNF